MAQSKNPPSFFNVEDSSVHNEKGFGASKEGRKRPSKRSINLPDLNADLDDLSRLNIRRHLMQCNQRISKKKGEKGRSGSKSVSMESGN